MTDHHQYGKNAENYTLEFLTKKGYRFIAKNYRFGIAEVDLIMQDGSVLVCVEVKARRSDYFGTPESFLSSRQIQRLVAAMDHYVHQNDLFLEIRFDLVAITVQDNEWKINHIKNAFKSFG